MPSNRIEQAFRAMPREQFLPAPARPFASDDIPIKIGFGQTNSQPSTVYKMLTWLDPQPGQKILDVGSGSGWTTALLAWLTRPTGHVFAVERIPELLAMGRDNCRRLGIDTVSFHQAGDQLGLPEYAPYDRILVSASTNELPETLIAQLRPHGKLVVPVDHSILVITMGTYGELNIDTHYGFVFVPLVS